MELEQARGNIGAPVRYRPAVTGPQAMTRLLWRPPAIETGEIVSVGETFVHVRYGTDTTVKATYPADLTLERGQQ